jgi:hypothetical protein
MSSYFTRKPAQARIASRVDLVTKKPPNKQNPLSYNPAAAGAAPASVVPTQLRSIGPEPLYARLLWCDLAAAG